MILHRSSTSSSTSNSPSHHHQQHPIGLMAATAVHLGHQSRLRACRVRQLLSCSEMSPTGLLSATSWQRPAVHCFQYGHSYISAKLVHQHSVIAAAVPSSSSASGASPTPASLNSQPAGGTPYYTGKIKRSSISGSSADPHDANNGNSSNSSSTAINKEPISSSMSPALYSYMLAHSREHPVLAELRQETSQMHGAQMQIAPEQGQLLSVLVELLGVRKAIEVGVFTGYSSLAVALALPPTGQLVAFDRDAKTMAVAQRYWDKAGVAGKVQGRVSPALQGLQELLEEAGEGSFDMAFIDADKRGYQAYFELCLKLVRPKGLIAVDNVLFYGKVADPAAVDKASLALKQFNDDLMADQRVSFSIVPIGDGMALCSKR